jgi:hypothetical protein
MSNDGNGPRTVLSPAQIDEMAVLRALGFSYTEARYRVLTPEQKQEQKRQIRAAERRRYGRNPYEEIIKAARGSANHRGVEFDITEGDLDWPEICPVFPWITLHYPGHYRHDPAGASLDRIDHEEGYVPGNVRVVSLRANVLRKDASSKELYSLAEFYLPQGYYYSPYLDEEFDADSYDSHSDD